MGVLIECVMLFAALLADLLLGNYGFAPSLTMYVLFHSTRCVSLRFATVAGLVLGTLIDFLYCREASGTPLWYMLALYSGELALAGCEKDDSGRVWRVVLPGAAIGGVLTLRWLIVAESDYGWLHLGALLDLVSGTAGGILKLVMVVLLEDSLCGYLGIKGFFPRKSNAPGARRPNRRVRRVRAEKVMGRRS